MTRTRGPDNLVAPRPVTVARIEADAHDSHAAIIEKDLGGRQPSDLAHDEGLQLGTLAVMVRPLALFCAPASPFWSC
ncbi:MAG: hypothetical protein ACOYLK_07530 [Sphingomonas sp.]